MFIKYRIIDKNVDDHSILVRYYTNKITEDFLASAFDSNNEIIRHKDGYPIRCRTDTNITIYNVDSSQEEIETLIKNNAPMTWFTMQEHDLKSNSNLLLFETGKEVEFESIIPEIKDPLVNNNEALTDEALTDEEIDKLLEQLTTKN